MVVLVRLFLKVEQDCFEYLDYLLVVPSNYLHYAFLYTVWIFGQLFVNWANLV